MTFFAGLRKGMGSFSENISVIVNTVLLVAVYFAGVGITAVAARLRKKKFLEMSLHGKSYWSKLNIRKKKLDEYYRQF